MGSVMPPSWFNSFGRTLAEESVFRASLKEYATNLPAKAQLLVKRNINIAMTTINFSLYVHSVSICDSPPTARAWFDADTTDKRYRKTV
jgi:hypothetical protein